jgi:DNA-binding transcriptional LysR family regulator
MTLHQFMIFVAIAKHRNLTKASQELRVSQPSVSQQMKLLQGYYGTELYRRTAKGVELTEAGTRFLIAIRPILYQVDKLKNLSAASLVRREPERLVVGGTHSPSAVVLPLLLARLKKIYPAAEISLRTNNGTEIERLLLKGQIEIALTTGFPKSPRIVAEHFRREKMILIASRRHPLARTHQVSLRDIQSTPFLIRSSGGRDGATARRLKAIEEQEGIKLTIGMRFESPNAVKEAVQRNMGIGVVYEDIVRYELRRGELKALRIRGLNLEGQTSIIYLNDRPLSKEAEEFLKLLRRSRPRALVALNQRSDQESHPILSSCTSAFEATSSG